jgi:hypothetical protein
MNENNMEKVREKKLLSIELNFLSSNDKNGYEIVVLAVALLMVYGALVYLLELQSAFFHIVFYSSCVRETLGN